jgi:PrtD family type I secretion system ABC transporter
VARFLWACALGFFINLLVLTTPIYMMQLFDRVVVSKSMPTLVFLTLIAVAALMLYGVFEMLRSRLLARTGIWLEQVVAPAALDKSLESTLRGGDCRTDALRDVGIVRNFMSGTGVQSLLDAPWSPLFLLLIFLLHPLLGLIAVLGALVLFALAFINDRMTHAQLRMGGIASSRALGTADMALRNVETVDAMGMSAAMAIRWALDSGRAAELYGAASDRSGVIHAASRSLRMILQLLVLGAGAWLAMNGNLTPGGMIAGSIILARALSPVEAAIGNWRNAAGAIDAYRRLRSFLATPAIRPETLPLPRPGGLLSVERVSFIPPGAMEPVVADVSFQLSPGEALGVIGPSAAGKTTLARLLVGTLKPTRGVVRLDGADIFARSRSEIGRWVGYVPQTVELFEGTVAENIARMADAKPRAIVRAAELAGAHDMILGLPNGYETQIGDSGVKLSGGQRQRIALARALFAKPALVVLDEPNSNLDAEGEHALNYAIANMKKLGSTVVVIGHRPSVLANVDKLLVLRAGRVEAFDTRQAIQEKVASSGIRALPGGAKKPAPAQIQGT